MVNYGKRSLTVKERYSKIKKNKNHIKELKIAPTASVEANSPIGLNRFCIQGTMIERSRLNNVQLVLFKS